MNRKKVLSTIFGKFESTYNMPFFVARVFQENPEYQTAMTWTKLLAETEQNCRDASDYLCLVNEAQIEKLGKLQLVGLLHYYMGTTGFAMASR